MCGKMSVSDAKPKLTNYFYHRGHKEYTERTEGVKINRCIVY